MKKDKRDEKVINVPKPIKGYNDSYYIKGQVIDIKV